jgi:hypothetical protein
MNHGINATVHYRSIFIQLLCASDGRCTCHFSVRQGSSLCICCSLWPSPLTAALHIFAALNATQHCLGGNDAIYCPSEGLTGRRLGYSASQAGISQPVESTHRLQARTA